VGLAASAQPAVERLEDGVEARGRHRRHPQGAPEPDAPAATPPPPAVLR
jgi:hypothetical protein